MKLSTDNWYDSNIGNNELYYSKVVKGKFCNDRRLASGYYWSSTGSINYAGFNRKSNTPILSCDVDDVYSLNVGAITMDEVVFAGGKHYDLNSYNYDFYLDSVCD